MFASTLYLIHRTLYLRNGPLVLEWRFYLRRRNTQLDGAYSGTLGRFTPDALLPHLRVFQFLGHVYTLIIEHDPPIIWARRLGTCFVHLYPTPTSLTPSRPFAPLQTFTRFILRFRNLENLCLE